MSVESLAYAETQTSAETLEAALKQAQHDFYDLPFAEGFNTALADQDIQPDDTNKPEYWKVVAEFAAEQSKQAREAGEDERSIVLRELLAATPDYIYAEAQLNRQSQQQITPEIRALKERTSHFNSLIRQAAESDPTLRASVLEKRMLNIANISIEDTRLKFASTNLLHGAVRGAQHEMAFGQLLEHTGRSFRRATTEEDVNGADYIVAGQHGPMRLDVKASLSQIEAKGQFNEPFAISSYDGQITMYSHVHDRELNDRFFVPDAIAAERGAVVSETLRYIEATSDAVVAAERQAA